MKQWLVRAGITLLLICIVIGIFRFSAHKAITKYPSFYVPLLKLEEQQLSKGNTDLQVKVVNLAGKVKNESKWSITITQEEFNGWLEKGLNETYPGLLPMGTYYPRVLFEPGKVYFACEYCPENFESVIWAQFDVSVPESGVIKVVVEKTRMGVIPISSSYLKSKIESDIRKSLAEKEGITFSEDSDSDLMKLTLEQMIEQWNLPIDVSQNSKGQFQVIYDSQKYDDDLDWKVDLTTIKGRKLIIDHLEIRHGELFMSGSTGKNRKK